MLIICSCKLWVDSIVVLSQSDGSLVTFTMRDGGSRSSADVISFGVKKRVSSLSNLINQLLEIYEEVTIFRK